ncbi:MAG: DMT family transporter [Candidatus Peregrinibacteria bacterium]
MFFFRSQSQERLGEILVFGEMLIMALFPILVHYGSIQMPPLFFAAITSLIAGLTMGVPLIVTNRSRELLERKVWKPIVIITLCIIVFPSILIYKGAQLTSGINTSILLTAEALFTLLFFHFVGERITRIKIFGTIAMFAGTALVVWNGIFELNTGALLILLATAIYPIGNYYAKKALVIAHPFTLIFARSLLGGLILLGFSLAFESFQSVDLKLLKDFWWILLLNGFLVSALSKVFWYEGIKRIEVGKAVIIGMSFPAFSMILATIFLKEIPTIYQLGGFLIILAGLYSITAFKPKSFSNAPEIH